MSDYIRKVLKDWRCLITEVTDSGMFVRFEDDENGLVEAEIAFKSIFHEGAYLDWKIVEYTNGTSGNSFALVDAPKITRKELDIAKEKAADWIALFKDAHDKLDYE